MAALNGKWRLESVENFEPYLVAIGVASEFKDQALKLLTPENNITQEIKVDGNNISIITTTPVGPREAKGTNGLEFDSPYFDGRLVKTKFQIDGDTLVENVSGSLTTTVVRALENNQMVMTLRAGDVTSVRRYDKV